MPCCDDVCKHVVVADAVVELVAGAAAVLIGGGGVLTINKTAPLFCLNVSASNGLIFP